MVISRAALFIFRQADSNIVHVLVLILDVQYLGNDPRLQRCHAVLMRNGKVDRDYNNVGHSCFELKAWCRRGQGVEVWIQ